MSEGQARSVLSRCPALADLDTQLGLTRMDAALLVLRHPRMLLPEAAEVVSFAVGRQCWWEQQQQQ